MVDYVRLTVWIVVMLVAVALTPEEVAASPVPEAPAGQASQEHYEVFLAPPASAIGSFERRVGYETASGQSGEQTLPENLDESILLREQLAGSNGSSVPPVVRGLLLTSSTVAAVSVDGGAPIPTVPAVGPAYGLRSVIYEIPGVKPSELNIRSEHRVRIVITPLDASGQVISTLSSPHQPLPNPALETRSWEAPAPAALGVCRISADYFPGLTAVSGNVTSVLRPVVGAIGPPYLTCANTHYIYRYSPTDESSLYSFMVLDAEHPGSAPAAMPAMEPVAGHPGVFQSRLTGRGLVARRVPGAWLLVEEGRDLQQRLSLLANLRATVHLQTATRRRRKARKHTGSDWAPSKIRK